MMARFSQGEVIQFKVDKSFYRVKGVGVVFYNLEYLSFDTHGNCIIRTAGTTIDYVDQNFRKLTKLEKALK